MIKIFNVRVNGKEYAVEVEEVSSVGAPYSAPVNVSPVAEAPKKQVSSSQGGVKVTAPMPGTVLKMDIKVGDVIPDKGLVCILEAMKMENEIFADKGGKVISIDAPVGSSVQTGDIIVTLG